VVAADQHDGRGLSLNRSRFRELAADNRFMAHARDRRKRDERKRAAGRRRNEARLDVRRRVRGLLQRFDLLAAFEAMPAYVRDQFYDCCLPDPVLVFDPSFPSAEAFGGAYAEIREEVIAAFDEAAIVLTGFDLPVRDFTAVAVPMSAGVRQTLASINSPIPGRPRMPTVVRTFLEKAAGVLQYLCRKEVEAELFNELHRAVIVPLVGRSRLDRNLLHAKLDMQETPRGRRMRMTLYAERPKMMRLHAGSQGIREPRTMHRVGTANVWNGIEWASWSSAAVGSPRADQLGMSEADGEWPVFVQEHALQRLRQRLDTYAHADWAQHWLYESMRKPTIVRPMSGGDWLVAFVVQGKRLGYLVVTPGRGMVVVRTFLFLTMRSTPEGRELARRLRLTPDEVDYLKLHELSRFTQTDLKDDPQLRALLSECGCGQLFELAEDEHALVPTARTVTHVAAELRQYVGLAA
jgi:hypothetical protein